MSRPTLASSSFRVAALGHVLLVFPLLAYGCSDGDGGGRNDGGRNDGGRNDGGLNDGGLNDNAVRDHGPRPECDYVHNAALSLGEPSELAGTTEAHNVWRHRVGVEPLAWNTDIAAHAQAWADFLASDHNCSLVHSSNMQRMNAAGFTSLGQNLAGGSGSLSGVGATTMWASERSDYDFGTAITNTNFLVFGHYTQIVWDDTSALGCGRATCGGATVIVCEYGTAGNFLGQIPYGEATGDCLDLDNDGILQVDDDDDTQRQ